MSFRPVIMTALLICTVSSAATADSSAVAKWSPHLTRLLARTVSIDSDSLVDVVIFLDNARAQSQISLTSANSFLKRSVRIKRVTAQLKNSRVTGYDAVKDFLNKNSANQPESFWVVPSFTARLSLKSIAELEQFSSIKLIVEDAQLTFDPPVDIKPAPSQSTSASTHLQLLNVPDLWSRGLTGKGRLICSFDTGVEAGHPALSAKWRGHNAPLSASWFSMVQPDSLPSDRVGHGTHTMGVMLGSTSDDTIGVAFDAQWISAGVIDQGRPLPSTISDIIAAFQWVLDPDGDPNTVDDVPDVLLNSWGIPKGLFAPCDETFWQLIDNVEAAGIVAIFAAGNEGPKVVSMRDPADRASSPLNSFSVGAVDGNKLVADFSSRGPSSCDNNQIKPEVVAPGVLVWSCTKDGGYGYLSGTSMAAPFIAGLVPLIRQYNPDATVEQIKNAILLSAEDLGPIGEDNAYGRGLPDASKILDFIPPPASAVISIIEKFITDVNNPALGEPFHLQVTLENPSGNIQQLTGRLVPLLANEAILTVDEAGFFFGTNGTIARSTPQFEISFDSGLANGREVGFLLELEGTNGEFFDSLYFTLTSGIAPHGTFGTQTSGRIELTVSDFGQYGLAPGSIYNVGGAGFRIDGGINLLYEAGIIAGRNAVQLVSSVRDSMGGFAPSEFGVVDSLSSTVNFDGGTTFSSTMRDNRAWIMIPLSIIQSSTTYGDYSESGFVILEYWVYNHTIDLLTSLYFGFVADFDLDQSGDFAEYDASLKIVRQYDNSETSVGIMGLENVHGFKLVINDSSKSGLSRIEKFDCISKPDTNLLPAVASDLMLITQSGPFTLAPGDSVKVALALVIGANSSDFYNNALRAGQRYNLPTDVMEDDENLLPGSFELHQNYPNPFNPTTTISFSLNKRQDVSLEIFNTLGQRVKILRSGEMGAGLHRLEWDATDDFGRPVASGVYFYRLETGAQVATRKMTLLK